METNVPGLYVAGVVAAGVEIGKLLIENGRLHAVAIVKHILARRGSAPAAPLGAPGDSQVPGRRLRGSEDAFIEIRGARD